MAALEEMASAIVNKAGQETTALRVFRVTMARTAQRVPSAAATVNAWMASVAMEPVLAFMDGQANYARAVPLALIAPLAAPPVSLSSTAPTVNLARKTAITGCASMA